MKNFPFMHNGEEMWYSRAIVCANYVFCKRLGAWWVLVAKRGSNQTSPGMWNVPGGFLDHDENTRQCAIRETLEETGFNCKDIETGYKFNREPVLFDIVDGNMRGKQHVVFNYYTNVGEVKNFPVLSNKFNEPGETEDIRWIPVDEVCRYYWLRGHKEHILQVYDQKINPSLKVKIRNYIIGQLNKWI